MNLIFPEFSHKDQRRELRQLITTGIEQINFYTAKKGSDLGNHYHKETTEFFFLTKGVMTLNGQTMPKHSLIAVLPQDLHKLHCVSDVEFLTFLTKAFNRENPDLHEESTALRR